MRVMIATGVTPTVGGVSSHVNSLSRAMRAAGHDVTVVTPLGVDVEFRPVRPGQSAVLGNLLRLPGGMLAAYWTSQRLLESRIRKALHANPCDIINAQDVSATNAVLRIPRGERPPATVLTIHGYLTAEALADRKIPAGGLSQRFLLSQERNAYRNASMIITVDRRLSEHAVEFGADPARLSVVQNFVDAGMFHPDAEARLLQRKRLGIKDDEFAILCPRRLVAKNGPEYLIRAMPAILRSASAKKPRAFLAGAGQQSDALRQLCATLGLEEQVTFLGLVPHDQTPDLYAAVDAVVIPSVTVAGVMEATSIAALEAMACGKPVVASAIGGLREVIEHGRTGILVPEKDPEALASAIISLMNDRGLGERLGGAAACYVRGNRSSVSAAERFISLYAEARKSASG